MPSTCLPSLQSALLTIVFVYEGGIVHNRAYYRFKYPYHDTVPHTNLQPDVTNGTFSYQLLTDHFLNIFYSKLSNKVDRSRQLTEDFRVYVHDVVHSRTTYPYKIFDPPQAQNEDIDILTVRAKLGHRENFVHIPNALASFTADKFTSHATFRFNPHGTISRSSQIPSPTSNGRSSQISLSASQGTTNINTSYTISPIQQSRRPSMYVTPPQGALDKYTDALKNLPVTIDTNNFLKSEGLKLTSMEDLANWYYTFTHHALSYGVYVIPFELIEPNILMRIL